MLSPIQIEKIFAVWQNERRATDRRKDGRRSTPAVPPSNTAGIKYQTAFLMQNRRPFTAFPYEDWKTLNSSSYNLKRILVRDIDFNKVQFTRDCTGERSDGRHTSRQIFHVMFKLSLAAAAVAIIKSTTRRLSSKDTLSHVSRQPEI